MRLLDVRAQLGLAAFTFFIDGRPVSADDSETDQPEGLAIAPTCLLLYCLICVPDLETYWPGGARNK